MTCRWCKDEAYITLDGLCPECYHEHAKAVKEVQRAAAQDRCDDDYFVTTEE